MQLFIYKTDQASWIAKSEAYQAIDLIEIGNFRYLMEQLLMLWDIISRGRRLHLIYLIYVSDPKV